MKQYIILILIAGLILFAAGCDGTPTHRDVAFIGGTTGLLISFEEGAPPREVYDSGDHEFEIVVKLKNDGEYTVPKEKVEVRITGIDPVEFSKTPTDMIKRPNEDLISKYKGPEGDIYEGITSYVVFSGLNRKQPLVASAPYTVRADVCYNYQTKARAMICIKPGMYDREGDLCRINEKKPVSNSGAPVHVTDFEQRRGGENIFVFTFNIKDSGFFKGSLYGKDTNCEETRGNENRVFVTVSTDMGGLSCDRLAGGTSGYVTLHGGTTTVRCTFRPERTGTFEKPIDIRIEYDYLQSISTPLLVKALGY